MKALLDFAVEIAREAGNSTLAWFGSRDLEVETKENDSPVTVADRKAEEILRRRISDAFPDDGILGEEFGEVRGSSGRRWILDPIDGTIAFVRGVPLYGTLLGLEEDGRMVLGAVHLPALGELIYAARGEGAWWVTGAGAGPRRAEVSEIDDPARALFCVTSVGGFVGGGTADVYERLRSSMGLDRGYGDCYGHMLVATGRAELMVDARMAIWDSAALQPIVEEAGGTFTDLSGNPTHTGGSAVSTNGQLRGLVAELLA
jgi:histidinol phosphatase-like enzyme (inositol monophosphatase family)